MLQERVWLVRNDTWKKC